MIKDWVARSMQIAMIEDQDDLEKIHALEVSKGYTLPNWNIQTLLQLPTIAQKWAIPDDLGDMRDHHQRIELELLKRKFNPLNDQLDGDPEISARLQWTHALDWNVFKRKGEIIWDFYRKTPLREKKASDLL